MDPLSTVIEFYAGPGTGKSTTSGYFFYQYKAAGGNAEYVQEYVKSWAWEKRLIDDFDQFYFFGKQLRREALLYGKTDTIITDSPLWMNAFYAQKFCPRPIYEAVLSAVKAAYTVSAQKSVKRIPVFLKRSKPYLRAGRYQSEQEAIGMDEELRTYLRDVSGITPLESGTSGVELDSLYKLIRSAQHHEI
jgi:hypothetical protein